MIHSHKILESGITEVTFPLPEFVIDWIAQSNWQNIDQYFLESEKEGGLLFEFLRPFLDFSSIEHIIAIRSYPDDEDGIWHDDGSRILGFSLSLTENHEEIRGGELRFRQKGTEDSMSFRTRPLGQILLFQTGIYGFEHMVTAVTKGKRVVLAGWCS